MAFVSDASPDQQTQNQTPGQNPLSQQAPITSAPNASSAKGATGQPSNTSPAQPFTNLSSYLSANAPQIQAEGQQIAGGLGQQYNQITGAIDQAGTKFNDQVNAGYTPMNQGVVDEFSSSPATVASDPTKAAAFKGMYGDAYTGPANFESTPDYLNLSGQVQNAVTNAQGIQTPSGIAGYFSATSPTYTAGMGNLDASLLQGNPGVVSTIQDAAKPFSGLPGYLTSAVTSGDAAAQAATQGAQTAKVAAQGAYKGFVDPFTQRLNDAYTTGTKGAVDYNTTLNDITGKVGTQDFASLTPDERTMIGFNPALLDLVSGYKSAFPAIASQHPVDFSGAFIPGPQADIPSPSSIVSPDDIANYQALQSLSGNAPALNFDMPTESATPFGASPNRLLPTTGPEFNNMNPANSMYTAVNPFYSQTPSDQMSQAGKDFMAKLLSFMNLPQPDPTPVNPGYQPPLSPPPTGSSGGGLHAF